MSINALEDQIVCFICGKHGRNPTPNEYPDHCPVCRFRFYAPTQHCMPDIVVENHGKLGVVFVQQKWGAKAPHSKNRVKTKDTNQIAELKKNGYVVFVVHNELIDNAEVTWMRALATSIWVAVSDSILYDRLHFGEKELVGLGA